MHWAEEMGREREREQARGRGLGDSAGWGGEGRRERVGPPGWVPFFYSFLLFFLFSFFSGFQTSLKLLNSNMNLNSTLALKQIKQCTSMNAQTILNLEKILITRERKLN